MDASHQIYKCNRAHRMYSNTGTTEYASLSQTPFLSFLCCSLAQQHIFQCALRLVAGFYGIYVLHNMYASQRFGGQEIVLHYIRCAVFYPTYIKLSPIDND